MWLLVLAIAVVFTGAVKTELICPAPEMTCISDRILLSSSDRDACPPKDTWEPESKVCNVCGGYTDYVEPGHECKDGMKCKPGYKCIDSECKGEDNSCQYTADNDTTGLWKRCCDGSAYEPKQCKGGRPNGRCFCVDERGNRIFGEQQWAAAENMTCACSRHVKELQDGGRKDVTLHCNELGNYEELQCDDGVCWCAEEKTGTPISRILPENMMTMLPCYANASLGSGYLRQCESMLIAQKRIQILMEAHGSIDPNFPYTNCEPDGSYGAVQLRENQLFCAWKDNTPIGGYAGPLSGMPTMTCRCARDKKRYGENIIQQECNGVGDYVSRQYTTDGKPYCVDSDGFPDDRTICD